MLRIAQPPVNRPDRCRTPFAIPLEPGVGFATRRTAARSDSARRTTVVSLVAVAVGAAMILAAGIAVGVVLNAATAESHGQDHQVATVHDVAQSRPLPHRMLATAANVQTGGTPFRADDDRHGSRNTSAAAPDTEPAQAEMLVRSTAASGRPFGVGMVEVDFADDQFPIVFPDQPLLLTESNQRIRFPVFVTSYRGEAKDVPHAARRITVHFLFLGDEPLRIDLASAGGTLLGRHEVVAPRPDPVQHEQLLEQWWRAYGEHVRTLNGNARVLRQLMQRALRAA